jgi:hypothetical protein
MFVNHTGNKAVEDMWAQELINHVLRRDSKFFMASSVGVQN